MFFQTGRKGKPSQTPKFFPSFQTIYPIPWLVDSLGSCFVYTLEAVANFGMVFILSAIDTKSTCLPMKISKCFFGEILQPYCLKTQVATAPFVFRKVLSLRVILSVIRPRSHFRYCSVPLRSPTPFRFASFRMTRANAVETRRANGTTVRIRSRRKKQLTLRKVPRSSSGNCEQRI